MGHLTVNERARERQAAGRDIMAGQTAVSGDTWATVPSVSYSVIERCNFKCGYCTAYGDAIKPGGDVEYGRRSPAAAQAVLTVCQVLLDRGSTVLRLTGGEPLLAFRALTAFLRKLRPWDRYPAVRVRLNTNGSVLERYAKRLVPLRLQCVKVSLDTVVPSTFAAITGRDQLNDVLRGVAACQSLGLNVELNAVLTKDSQPNIDLLVRYCIEKRIPTLKLLDLYLIDDEQYWRENYVDPRTVIETLEKRYGRPTVETLSGNRGSPMVQVRLSEYSRALVKDCRQGTTYSEQICATCARYPCQNGLLTATVTSNGFVSACHLRPDLAMDMRKRLRGLPLGGEAHTREAQTALQEALQPFTAVYWSDEFFRRVVLPLT